MRKTLPHAVLFMLGSLVSLTAHADATKPLDAPISFDELPVDRFTTPPAKKPSFINPRETVPGLFVVSPPQHGIPMRERVVWVMTDPRLAQSMKSGEGMDFLSGAHGCLSDPFRMDHFGRQKGGWSETQSAQIQLMMKSADNPTGGVTAVHAEEVVQSDKGATLEIIDAWVDPATKGARLISKASLPLKLVRGPFFGVNVYAARDERDGKVDFVVVRPKSKSTMAANIFALRPDGMSSSSTQCTHHRVELETRPTGDLATFVVHAELPSLDPKPIKPRAERIVREGFSEVEVRTRQLHVQVSVSQLSREKSPLVSVSATWAQRESIERAVVRDD